MKRFLVFVIVITCLLLFSSCLAIEAPLLVSLASIPTAEYEKEGFVLVKSAFYAPGASGMHKDGSIWYKEFEYNDDGNITWEITHSGDGTVWKDEYEYDSNGVCISKTIHGNSGDKVIWNYEYNADGKNIRTTYRNSGGLISYDEYKYDAKGNCIAETYHNPDGTQYGGLENEYDAYGNCIRKTELGPIGGLWEYVYGTDGKLITASWSYRITELWEYGYDYKGNRIKEIYQNDGVVVNWTDYEYDIHGNLIKETRYNADGSVSDWIDYEYAIVSYESAIPKDTRGTVDFYLKSVNRSIKLDIAWNDNLFSQNILGHRPKDDLALAAIALAQAAYDEARVTAILRNFGFDNFDPHYELDADDEHPLAYIFARKRSVIDGKPYTIAAIICRGTIEDAEWKSNFDFSRTKKGEHNGFATAADTVMADFRAYISSGEPDNPEENLKIFITGHSRGAAVSNLLASSFIRSGIDDIYAYCFASPNTVGGSGYKTASRRIINIINNDDSWICDPPTSWTRHGTTYRFSPKSEPDMLNKFKELTDIEYDPKLFNSGTKHTHALDSYLAYLLTQHNSSTDASGEIKIVSVKCPVDVDVYDALGNLVGRVSNGIVDYTVDMGVSIWLDGDEKHFIMPSYEEFTLIITGTDTGLMDYSVGYANTDTWEMREQINFQSVELFDKKRMRSIINDVSDVRLFVIDKNGDATSEIMFSGTEMPLSTKSSSARILIPIVIAVILAICLLLAFRA